MAWMVGIAIWLMMVAILIVFFCGAFGPDTEKERQQDWEDFKRYIERRNKDA